MYGVTLHLKPTAGLTFRILPGSILDIATYPFVPPTTLSGFLRRLVMIRAGLEFPNTGPNDENTPFYALPRDSITLGAYPFGARTRPPHRTYRKGPKDLGHKAFSMIYRGQKSKGKENIQLHTWEYLITEELIGYVVSKEKTNLDLLAGIEGYGAKLGKEGFAFVERIDGPFELTRMETQALSSTVVDADEFFQKNPGARADVFTLYHFVWKPPSLERSYSMSPSDPYPSSIMGYKPFVAALPDSKSSVTLDFWSYRDIFIPAMLVDLLHGEVCNEP